MRNDGLIVSPVADRLSGEMERLSAQWSSLKKPEGAQDRNALKKAAQEFEALFVNYLIKTMQDTVGESTLFGNGLGADSYRDMMFQELSRKLTQGDGIGLAKQLLASLRTDASPSETDIPPLGPDIVAPMARPSFSKPALELAPAAPPVPPDSAPDSAPDSEETFILPVRGRQTSGYGVRSHPLDGHTHFHRGLDLAAPKGSPILAARSGEVVFSGYQKGYGNTVVIDHGDGYRTRYAHLQTADVSTGDYIAQGHSLGRVGQTGRATGPHLHFEVSHNGIAINPRDIL